MASLVIIGNETNLAKALVALTDIPGRSTPLYLGARYEGKELTLSGYVLGTSYSDAKSYLDTLESNFKNQESWTVGDFTGYVQRFSYSLAPKAKSQKVAITLRRFD